MKFFWVLLFLFGCGEVTNISVDAGADTGNDVLFGKDVTVLPGTGGMSGSLGGDNGNSGGGSGGHGSNPVNSSCTGNWDCMSNYCLNNICAIPKKVNGDGCTSSDQCVSNWCHPELGICRDKPVPRQPGETCSFDWECLGYCSTATTPNMCHVTGKVNTPCTRNAQCDSTVCDLNRSVCL